MQGKLHQIISLTKECLENLGSEGTARKQSVKSKVQIIPAHSKSLRNHIVEIRDSGFFKQPKTAREIHEKLQTVYPCDLNRVEVALVRLGKQLRKTSKLQAGKRITAYVW